jgi:nucleotide-binding universal stress UspA family protein
MTVKTIFVGFSFGSTLSAEGPPESLKRYALALAASHNAHLSIGVGAFDVSVRSALLQSVQNIVAAYNEELRRNATLFVESLMADLRAEGVVGAPEVAQGEFRTVARRFVRMARVSDLAILEPSNEIFSLQMGLIEEILFDSGRPVIVVPKAWAGGAALERIVVAWDGGPKAARAVGDALPLLEQAKDIDIVVVSDDPDATKRMAGAELAPHLARHCRSVTVADLRAHKGDVAAALSGYAQRIGANLLVMGAYGRARIIEATLGGVTRAMLDAPPVPLFMSY